MSDVQNTQGEQHSTQYLTFRLGGEVYALSVETIREIIQFGFVTEVPMIPDLVRGVINLRGVVIPVIDLAVRFGKERMIEGKRTCIIIVSIPDENNLPFRVGLMVDAVLAVVVVPDDDVGLAPGFGGGIRMDFVRGIIRQGGNLVIVLDIMHVLASEELAGMMLQSAREAIERMSDNH